MGNLIERSSQPDLISGTHLALLEQLDPTSKFVTAHAKYRSRRDKRESNEEKRQSEQELHRTRSELWLQERKREHRTGDDVDPNARTFRSETSPTHGETRSITLDDVRNAVTLLKTNQSKGGSGSFGLRRDEFLTLFGDQQLAPRLRAIWTTWCEAAAEDDAQQARVDSFQLLGGMIWLVPGSVGHERLRAAVELFDPRCGGESGSSSGRRGDERRGGGKRGGQQQQPSLSESEVSTMILTTLSGLCVWTDGFFLPPQANHVSSISSSIFREEGLEFDASTGRAPLRSLSRCAAALEQVSLERILCKEILSSSSGAAAGVGGTTTTTTTTTMTSSSASRTTWMESFYYRSYDRKRLTSLSFESVDNDEGKRRSAGETVHRPTDRDLLSWKHEIVGPSLSTPTTKKLHDLFTNVHLLSMTLTSLDQLNDRKIELLTMYLTMNWSHLETLVLESCQLASRHVVLLSDGIAINDSIKLLNLRCNDANEKGGVALGKALRLNTSIIQLDISQNKLGDVGGRAIGEALAPFSLSLSSSERRTNGRTKRTSCLDDPMGVIETEGEKEKEKEGGEEEEEGEVDGARRSKRRKSSGGGTRNVTLVSLSMRSNSIGRGGGMILGDVLRTHPRLAMLDLRDNRLGDDSVAAMAGGIVRSQWYFTKERMDTLSQRGHLPTCPLTWLDVSGNSIHDQGVEALSKAISCSASFDEDEQKERRSLHDELKVTSHHYPPFMSSRPFPVVDLITLDLSRNNIRARGAVLLAESMEGCPSLTSLDVSDNKIGFRYANSEHEKRSDYDKVVFNYDEAGPRAFAKCLDLNRTLTCLNLSMNSIGTEGGRVLLESLQWSETLELLSLSGNEMSQEVVDEQEEIGDPRLDLSCQKRMRIRGATSLSLPTRRREETNGTTLGTKSLSVSGNSRSYYAGGPPRSQTEYHYQHTRWPENTRREHVESARRKLLPADGKKNKITKDGGGGGGGLTPLQEEWKLLMRGPHSVDLDPLHTKEMLLPAAAPADGSSSKQSQ